MTDLPVNLTSSGPPETVLPAEDPAAIASLEAALAQPADSQKAAVAAVVAQWPRCIDAWAQLGSLTGDAVERYAYYRVGYHRGLDKLRGSGWRGSGFVRWEHETNRGFLRTLSGLRSAAAAINEQDEVERIAQFLRQLDPDTDVDAASQTTDGSA